jgi:DNA (cytosine-5)-methyltransferase 1
VNVLDLFSGIGGFSLGLERAGFQTVAFCEIDPFCVRVLNKHWPGVPVYDDVRTLSADRLRADGIEVDVICGGFPCQDISFAGKGAGLAGERSGLWREYARLVGELRPRYVIVENVSALLARGLGDVLGDLAAFGYDAEWHCIPASAVGAPHRRDRLWVLAYPNRAGRLIERADHDADGEVARCQKFEQSHFDGCREALADAIGIGTQVSDWRRNSGEQLLGSESEAWRVARGSAWCAEPELGRVADGISNRVDRLRALGNAVVPQIPELIGRAIMASQR